MRDVVRHYLERALYDLRFEETNLRINIKYDEERIAETETKIDMARQRLYDIGNETQDLYKAAEALGIEITLRERMP